jgi:SH3-like domain-containing protein
MVRWITKMLYLFVCRGSGRKTVSHLSWNRSKSGKKACEQAKARPEMIQSVLLLLALTIAALPASAAPVLRYVSQRTDRAYLREGPSYAHRVLWVYRHRGMPFAVTASYDVWRRVTAADGTTGWMSASMLSDRRTIVVIGKGRAQIRGAGGKLVGLADMGAIANLKSCQLRVCEISARGIDGRIDKSRIWGVGASEVFR